MPRPIRARWRPIAALAIAAIGITACSSSKSSTASDDANAKVTLTVGLFGTFGFKEAGLYDQYMKLHPNVTIKEDDVEQSADYWTRLKTRLASGSGLDDVQGIEIGFVADVVQNHASQFVDFASLPEGNSLKSSFYDWKWQQASTSDGKTSAWAPTPARKQSATGRTCSRRPGFRPMARRWPASGPAGTTSSTSASSTRLGHQAQGQQLRRQRRLDLLHRGLSGQRGLQRFGRQAGCGQQRRREDRLAVRDRSRAGQGHRSSVYVIFFDDVLLLVELAAHCRPVVDHPLPRLRASSMCRRPRAWYSASAPPARRGGLAARPRSSGGWRDAPR